MEVRLNPDLQAKLARLAARQGRDDESLVVEAVERLVDYEEWLVHEVEKRLAAAGRGELIDHADVRKLIDGRYPGGCGCAGRNPPPATSLISATTIEEHSPSPLYL